MRHQFSLLLCWGTTCVQECKEPAQIRDQHRSEQKKSTEQKFSLLFITIHIHLDERVQSFKEKRAVRDMKYNIGVANDTEILNFSGSVF